ncbi:MAG: tetratricopeptide repeat protein [Acidobacteria bacterium]|nr:tetratricopeptide repeat protein [Acidobacteriota bacterium]
MPWARRLVNTALVVAGVVVACLLGELIVRLAGMAPAVRAIGVDGQDYVYQRSSNPLLSYELKKNYRNDHADLLRNYPRTNSFGQRDLERKVAATAGVRRVILLGDSVVEGVGLREMDDLISRQLEQLYPGGTLEVLNFGVSGYCTAAEVELLRTKGLQFRPDVVVLIFVENDFDNFNQEAWLLEDRVRRPEMVKQLFLHSHLFRVLALRLDLFSYGADSRRSSASQAALGNDNVVDGFTRLRRLASQEGFAPVIAIWPRFTHDAVEDVHFMPASDDLVIERLARVNGIPSVRLSPFFRRDRDRQDHPVNPRVRYTIGDSIHPSRVGSRVAAAALKEILDDLPPAPLVAGPMDSEAAAAAAALSRAEVDSAVILLNAGSVLLMQGENEQAVAAYRQALEIRPDYVKAENLLGVALTRLGELDEAEIHYRRALSGKLENLDAYSNLADLLVERGGVGEAEGLLHRALDLRPDDARTHFTLGNLLVRQERGEEAVEQYRQALAARPDYPEARQNLAELLRRLDR